MLRAYSTADVREAEAAVVAAAPLDSLMKRAADAVAQAVAEQILAHQQVIEGSVIAGLVGGGDNGGDALYALAFLQELEADCVALCMSQRVHPRALAAARKAGVEILNFDLETDPDELAKQVVEVCQQAGAWIDGLVGSGATGPLRSPLDIVVRALAEEKLSCPDEPIVVAVDIPSGLSAEDGALTGPFIPATVTVTMAAPKPQLLVSPAAWHVGELRVVDLGITPPRQPAVARLFAGDVNDAFVVPRACDHKYTRGVVQVVAGSSAYPMTGIMCAEGAARAGAGMVRFWGPDEAALAVLSRLPEAVGRRGKFQSLLVGSGIDPQEQRRVNQAVSVAKIARQERLPQVLDAGALEFIDQIASFKRDDSPAHLLVLTPHAGEAAQLLSALGHQQVSRQEVEARPLKHARDLVELTGATVVLKGANTLIVGPEGDCYSQNQAPAWAATAGSGDVLAGVIASVLASFQALHESSADAQSDSAPDLPALSASRVALAAAVGVWIHGTAAALASGTRLGPEDSGTDVATSVLSSGEDGMPLPNPQGAAPSSGYLGHPILAGDIARCVPLAIGLALSC